VGAQRYRISSSKQNIIKGMIYANKISFQNNNNDLGLGFIDLT